MIRATLLTATDCHLCEHAKHVLDLLGRDFDLSVETMDIASGDGLRLARSAGVILPPGLLLDGRLAAHGRLSERRLRRDLARRQAAAG